jgi:hypothetical protein
VLQSRGRDALMDDLQKAYRAQEATAGHGGPLPAGPARS